MPLQNNKIKAVIFDWGGVCCQEGEPFASLDLQYTLAMKPEEIAQKARAIYDNYYIGKHNRDSFWGAILNFFGLKKNDKLNPETLSRAYLESYRVYPEVLALAQKLRRNYKIGLLSNLTPEMRDWVAATHDLGKFFDAQVYSCDTEVAAMKPEPKPYLAICEKLMVKPSECLFIDNSPKNSDAAEQLGMRTILFERVEKFLEDIKFLL